MATSLFSYLKDATGFESLLPFLACYGAENVKKRVQNLYHSFKKLLSPLSPPPASPFPPPQLPTAAVTSSDPAHGTSVETAPAQGQTLHPSVLPPVLTDNQDPSADLSSLISSSHTMTSKEAIVTQASASQPPIVSAGTLTVKVINLLEKFSKHYFLHKNIAKADQVEKLLFCFESAVQQVWIAAKKAEFRKLGFEEFMAALHTKWLRDGWEYMLGI
ncbi:hypothetical protein C0995_016650 [Termitomyces sp. Mi166|nr:hypothetical protein C0995_016650 [Termitomyces sp. Mi166\